MSVVKTLKECAQLEKICTCVHTVCKFCAKAAFDDDPYSEFFVEYPPDFAMLKMHAVIITHHIAPLANDIRIIYGSIARNPPIPRGGFMGDDYDEDLGEIRILENQIVGIIDKVIHLHMHDLIKYSRHPEQFEP